MGWQDDPLAYSVDANTQKFLDFIGKAEGADYNTIVGGGKFNSYAQHPNVVGLRTSEGPSTAAGKYQIVGTTYRDVAPKMGITDFSPESQDRIAVELIKRAGALEDVQSGNYQAAIKKLGSTWASLPSSPYSQPKRSQSWVESALDMVVSPAQAAQSKGSWMNDPVVGEAAPQAAKGGWMNDPVVGEEPVSKVPPPGKVESAPLPDITPKKEEPKSWLRTIDDAVRGVADMATFGYADEIAAKMDTMFGGGQSGKTNYEEALKAQRQRDAEGGTARTVGQVGGALIPGAGVLNVVRAPANATRFGRAVAGAASGGATGALYGSGAAEGDLADRAQGAVTGGALGAATGGVLGGLLPATAGQVATKFEKKAGDKAAAAVDAEIITDLNKIATNETQRGNVVGAVQANALEQKYVTDATRAIKQLGKEGLAKTGLAADDVQAALQNRRILTADELSKLRGNPAGDALADAIEKAQRTRSLTAPVNAADNIIARTGRAVLDLAPIPQPLRYAGQRILGARSTREDQIQKLIGDKNAKAAEILAGRVGPSAATQSLEKLQGVAQKAQAANIARKEAQQVFKQQAAANTAKGRINSARELGFQRGGPAQEFLERTGVDPTDMPAVLKFLSKRYKGTNAGEAASQLRRSPERVTNVQGFYDIQDLTKSLNKRGVLQEAGALSTPLKAAQEQASTLSSGIRNPISYAENVRNAGAAVDLAASNAPTKALAQFARKVAGTKSIADKEKMIADRLKKAIPDEAAFLDQFVSPLTQFGKK